MNPRARKFGPRLTVSLTGTNYDTLSALAEKDDVSASWIVRRAIDEYLRRRRKEINSPAPVQNTVKRGARIADKQQDRSAHQRGRQC
jgi:predicted transcriptional regulator